MKDIRLLTLYKQYYLDSYPNALKCQYTTWGYYDGMDITKEDGSISCSNLFEKRSEAPISQIWYNTGEKTRSLEGRYGNQNIGLFRCVSDKEEERAAQTEWFWSVQSTVPFTAVGFLQLKDSSAYERVSREIDKKGKGNHSRLREKYCSVITYCTYDNADLVVLLQANSLAELEGTLKAIESMPAVRYMHPIMGISEPYLWECKKSSEILEMWGTVKCFMQERISRLDIHIVTSGDTYVVKKLKKILDNSNADWSLRGYQKAECAHTFGHENVCITLSDTDVRSLAALLIPGGFATHQNVLYGKGVYNIETSFSVKKERWSDLNDDNIPLPEKELQNKTGVCRVLLEKYRSRLEKAKSEDESLYSYYQALMQTINTMDQYENFGLSKNIFWALFPALSMFDKLLDKAIEDNSGDYYGRIESIKRSVKRFLDSVNSVIYHTIHTDQMFLMVPGYSGTPFSIPIKLSLLYLWMAGKVINVLNDSSHEYCCILAPEMESRPITNVISFGLPARDRLILVRLSQRSLFLPRDLMVILTHEIAHYVSEKIRNRNARLDGILVTLAYFIGEYIFPTDYDPNPVSPGEMRIFEMIKKYVKANLQTEALRFFVQCKDRFRQKDEKEVYANELSEKLFDVVWNFISPVDKGAHRIIFEFPDHIREEIERNDEEFSGLMQFISRIQQHLDANRRKMQGDRRTKEVINRLIKIYREVFSDIAAAVILNIDENDFSEAFQISEGREITDENKPEEQMLREKIVHFVLNRNSSDEELLSASYQEEETEEAYYGEEQEQVISDLFFYRWSQKELLIYARNVYALLNRRVQGENCGEDVRAVRELFNLFKGNPDMDCAGIYRYVNKCLMEYAAEQEKERQNWLTRL